MRDFFSQFGKVVDATVMLDRETGRSKGFGFVSFEGVNVEPLLGYGNLEIDGKMASFSDLPIWHDAKNSSLHRLTSSSPNLALSVKAASLMARLGIVHLSAGTSKHKAEASTVQPQARLAEQAAMHRSTPKHSPICTRV